MASNFDRKLRLPRIHFRALLHAANMQHGTKGFTSLPKEGVLSIFFALKNPTASAGFEPANLGTKGQHATSRPPKPLSGGMVMNIRVPLTRLMTISCSKTHTCITFTITSSQSSQWTAESGYTDTLAMLL